MGRKLTAIKGFEVDQVLEELDRITDCLKDLCSTSAWLTNLKTKKRKKKNMHSQVKMISLHVHHTS